MYHVCHKCGLPRSKDKDDIDLGWCICLGQTWFEYEELGRTEDEARGIALQHFYQWRELYDRQGRSQEHHERLCTQYSKVIA